MEEKISVNEYVRTKDGKIGIFDRYSSRKENSLYKSPFNCFIKIRNRKTPLQCCEDYIAKHSKQLIDLVEVGDFVNGYKVTDKYLFAGEKPVLETEGNDTNCKCLCEEDIKTILTKEMYAQNCYKVGEKE